MSGSLSPTIPTGIDELLVCAGTATDAQTRSIFTSAVDAAMLELLGDGTSAAHNAARASITAGGKRLRPLLALAALPHESRSIEHWQRAIAIGAATELLHTASLIHDDVLDNAITRRRKPTIHSEQGFTVAAAAGDLLFSRSFTSITNLGESGLDEPSLARLVRVLAQAAVDLAEGEALQEQQFRDWSLNLDAYLQRCAAKTAVLFATTLELVALACGVSPEYAGKLQQFGMEMGIAFQIVDDLLDCDVESKDATLGKRPGTDLLDGTVTAPMLFALRSDPSLLNVLSAGPFDDVNPVLLQIANSGAIEETRSLALEFHDRAIQHLADLEDIFDSRSLAMAAKMSIERLH